MDKTKSTYKATFANTILCGSLISFGVYLTIAIFGGITFTLNISYLLSNTWSVFVYIIAAVLSMALLFAILITGPFWNVYALGIFSAISMFFVGFLTLGYVFNRFLTLQVETWKILSVLFIPAAVMMLTGTLAYFNLINFKKVWIILILLFITSIIIALTIFFVSNRNLVYALYSLVACAIFAAYMAVDWYLITRFNKKYKELGNEFLSLKKAIKMSMYFGFKLSYDYVMIVYYISRFFK